MGIFSLKFELLNCNEVLCVKEFLLLRSLQQSLSHGEEVHGVLDDAAVARHQSGVDGLQERPGVCMSLHLHQNDPGGNLSRQSPTCIINIILKSKRRTGIMFEESSWTEQ